MDPRNLLVLAGGCYGVEQRIGALLVHLATDAPDWPAMVEELRGLLWDNADALALQAEAVVPVLVHYLRQAYARCDSPDYRGRIVDTCLALAQRLARHADDRVIAAQVVLLLHVLGREALPHVATPSNLRPLFALGRLLRESAPGEPQRIPLICLTHLVRDALQVWGRSGMTCPCHVLVRARATLAASILPQPTAHKPEVQAPGPDWRMRANPSHLWNLQCWLEIMRPNPAQMQPLIRARTHSYGKGWQGSCAPGSPHAPGGIGRL